jgi:hypothetical protein
MEGKILKAPLTLALSRGVERGKREGVRGLKRNLLN